MGMGIWILEEEAEYEGDSVPGIALRTPSGGTTFVSRFDNDARDSTGLHLQSPTEEDKQEIRVLVSALISIGETVRFLPQGAIEPIDLPELYYELHS